MKNIFRKVDELKAAQALKLLDGYGVYADISTSINLNNLNVASQENLQKLGKIT